MLKKISVRRRNKIVQGHGASVGGGMGRREREIVVEKLFTRRREENFHKNQPKKLQQQKNGEMGFLSSTDNVCCRIPVTLLCIVY